MTLANFRRDDPDVIRRDTRRKRDGGEYEKIDTRNNVGRNTTLGLLVGASGGALIGSKSFEADEKKLMDEINKNWDDYKTRWKDAKTQKFPGRITRESDKFPKKQFFNRNLKGEAVENPKYREFVTERELMKKQNKQRIQDLRGDNININPKQRFGGEEIPLSNKFRNVSTNKLKRIGKLGAIGAVGLGGLAYLGSER